MNSLSRLLVILLTVLFYQTVAAQELVDTVGLRSRPTELKTEPLAEDGLSGIITFETYQAIGKGGPVTICEVMSTYLKRNRKDNLILFIRQNVQWPENGGMICVEGRVFVSFVVGTDGRVYRTNVRKGIHPLFDAEALRVVQLLSGHFSPAICGGIARAHEMVVPVSFSLESIR